MAKYEIGDRTKFAEALRKLTDDPKFAKLFETDPRKYEFLSKPRFAIGGLHCLN